jgi:hypothetical protein
MSLKAIARPAAREQGLGDPGAEQDGGEGRLDRVGGAKVDPVPGRIVVAMRLSLTRSARSNRLPVPVYVDLAGMGLVNG